MFAVQKGISQFSLIVADSWPTVILNVTYSPAGACPEIGKGGGRNFMFPFPLKISVKTKKKMVFKSFDVQFTPQNQVKTKKKVIASSDVLFPLFR